MPWGRNGFGRRQSAQLSCSQQSDTQAPTDRTEIPSAVVTIRPIFRPYGASPIDPFQTPLLVTTGSQDFLTMPAALLVCSRLSTLIPDGQEIQPWLRSAGSAGSMTATSEPEPAPRAIDRKEHRKGYGTGASIAALRAATIVSRRSIRMLISMSVSP